METLFPKVSPETVSEAPSFACCDQDDPDLTNMYADPAAEPREVSKAAPTITYPPEMETLRPNWSFVPLSEATSFACCDQDVEYL